jgi:hypothetical protein
MTSVLQAIYLNQNQGVMNIAFGGMESYSDNIRNTRKTLDKYFRQENLILFNRKTSASVEHKSANAVTNTNIADQIREEEERMILGAWILGALGVGSAVMTLAA